MGDDRAGVDGVAESLENGGVELGFHEVGDCA